MNKTIKFPLFVAIILSSCIHQQENGIQSASPQPTFAKETSVISVPEYISNTNYLKECLEINPSSAQSQIGFLNIYPGTTTSKEVNETIGDPDQVLIDGNETNWYYDGDSGVHISIILVEDRVDRISIDSENSPTPHLKEIVEEYGCPNLITLVDRSEHSAGNYDVVVFCYPEIGIEFWFKYNNIKLSIESTPNETRYIRPIDLADYIKSYSPFLDVNSPFIKPVYWNEVVVDK